MPLLELRNCSLLIFIFLMMAGLCASVFRIIEENESTYTASESALRQTRTHQLNLHLKRNKCLRVCAFMFVCLCERAMCVRVRLCVRAYAYACVYVCVCVCVRTYVPARAACAYATMININILAKMPPS